MDKNGAVPAGLNGSGSDIPTLEQWALEQNPLPMALFDRQGVCLAVNVAMTRAMGKPKNEVIGTRIGCFGTGQPIEGLEGIGAAVEAVWRHGEVVQKEVHLRVPGEDRTHAWLLTLSPFRERAGHVRAVALTAVDATEQFHARRRLSVLNEAGLRIGTTLDVARTADELAQVGTDHFADFVVVDLLDSVLSGEETEKALFADRLIFRRVAQRSVIPGCPEAVVAIGATHSYHEESPSGRALAAGCATRHGVDDTTLRSWAAGSPRRARRIRIHGIHSMMVVPLRARGVTLGLAIFSRHQTPEPFDEEDLRLADELAARAAVYVDNARRYTREREIALTLQGRLLPDNASRQAGVEVASNYLPADPSMGIGGDWFDVIPLSGARVALVVGDVVGRGIQASATMGRLCTAVRTLAEVELTPDELLTQLDDLVLRLDRQETASGTRRATDRAENEVGATCLYVVYDPVSRRCCMARAGHPEPALVTDGKVDFLDVPAGPPLGVGGLPFEVAEFELPEGSVLALYTDGLIESPVRDLDRGQASLRDALAQPNRSLEEMGDRVVHTLLPDVRTDDAALLLIRTHALEPDQVATWELSAGLPTVARARELACGQLDAWHLEESAFIVELVVSELVTNAIRYGVPPVQLRLIRDSTTLICEVSDNSNAAPHLRRARTFDEGGRGLLIVAQLTDRWGCRYTQAGKTIWAEVPIPVTAGR
ncbi:SpoIIE family protein phosphatase [Streptomyces sioyaensis]|uniref:SpoIIE family protein phosphatase n=1 Tax=Streptomyces sioyaensis TaxID=67364 RepID=UPI003D70704F